ncbi:MAG: c-type cytochrome domain-containing protein, partial [Gemmataceae bacterium]
MGRKRFIEFSAFRVTWLVALPVYLLSPSFAAFGQEKTGPVSFIRDIAPIFKESCLGCHGSKNPKGKLDMTRYDLLRKGGTKDDPIVEGKPEDSYLMDVLIATDKKRMPPLESGEPLPPEKIKR